MRIALAQCNTSVGDLRGNAGRILEFARQAHAAGAELLITPELAVTGYPPQDLLLKPHFIRAQREVLMQAVLPQLPLPALIGFVDDSETGRLFNAAALCDAGSISAVARKALLPTYDVFDECRYFSAAPRCTPLDFRGLKLGVTICEDLWDERYQRKVTSELRAAGADLLVNLSASPYHHGKGAERLALLRRHVTQTGLPLLYCNLVAGQDELIFDGDSLCLDVAGTLVARGRQFAEDLLLVELIPGGALRLLSSGAPSSLDSMAELAAALTLGIGDYFAKCGFSRAVLGLSGGIDSAVVACLGAAALGPENLACLAMPSRFNAPESTRDAELLAQALGCEFHVLPIEASVRLAVERFETHFGTYADPLTAENLQARERGKTLMELSNDRGALVLSTGNKTEYSLGYTTLYGDMCGALAVLGDVDKPTVYELARWFNREREIIPAHTIERPPSAELRSGQVDPFDYSRISPLADLAVEEHLSRAELIERGYATEEVDLVLRLVRISEHKRWQAPPVLRVTEKAFGSGRRMPIACGFME